MQIQNSKYELLNAQEQAEVQNFINKLLKNKESEKRLFNASRYKKKLLRVSVWSDEETSAFKKNNKAFKAWSPPTW
jgi:hypothetical protein